MREGLTSISPLGMPSNREGLIHPSTTNHPPKFTPLTFESPGNPSTKITSQKKKMIHNSQIGFLIFSQLQLNQSIFKKPLKKIKKMEQQSKPEHSTEKMSQHKQRNANTHLEKRSSMQKLQAPITSKNPRNKEGDKQNHKKPQIEERGISLNYFLIIQIIPKRTLSTTLKN